MRSSVLFVLTWAVCFSASAQDKVETKAEAKSDAEKLAARRLEFMKNSVKDYEFLLGPDFKAKLTVEPEPRLRFTNPVSGLQDGGFFLWKSDSGRPMVGAQVFLTGDSLWIHEFQSLSPVPFRASRNDKITWEPKRAGVEVKPVPDAPVPAASAVQRLVQMRDIAKRFTASDEFEGRPQSDELRLLRKPLVRFGAENSDTLDGALFVHAHGTDPELMIVLEALKSDDGYRWHYSLAPMTGSTTSRFGKSPGASRRSIQKSRSSFLSTAASCR
ncbi:MAG: hypothetical protein FD138_3392 [Planctomycetota bacterium]|nr:MAG: hypothetical protein FD138_3392 [Planctomycetota bacterium]